MCSSFGCETKRSEPLLLPRPLHTRTAFSGLVEPVSSLAGAGRFIGEVFPTAHFLTIARGTFSKGHGFADLQGAFLHLLIVAPVLIWIGAALLKKQGLLLFMVMLPMQILSGAGGIIRAQALSGGLIDSEGMPDIIDVIMQAAPTSHFVPLAQAILSEPWPMGTNVQRDG